MSTLTPSDIALRDARRMAEVLREVGGDGAPNGSGWMACDVPGSWSDFAVGLGLDGPAADHPGSRSRPMNTPGSGSR